MAGNGINAGASLYNRFVPNTMRDRYTLTRSTYQRVLMELAMNRFKWEGLPDGVDERHIEINLLSRALCLFYFDEEYGRYLAVQATPAGPINMYNNPTHFHAVAPQLSRTLAATRTTLKGEDGKPILDAQGLPIMRAPECVPIWANYLRVPDWDVIELYTGRLVEMDKTIDTCIQTQRHPFIVTCDVDSRKSLTEAFRQVQEGQPIIWGMPALADIMTTGVQALDVGVDKELLLNLMTAKTRIWNECMTMLGINNSNQDKKERLVVAEVGANDDQIMSTRMVALKSRQMACELINQVFPDVDVSVEWNQEEPKGGPMAGMMGLEAQPFGADDEDGEDDEHVQSDVG